MEIIYERLLNKISTKKNKNFEIKPSNILLFSTKKRVIKKEDVRRTLNNKYLDGEKRWSW